MKRRILALLLSLAMILPMTALKLPANAETTEYVDGDYTYTVLDNEAILIAMDSFFSLYNNQTVPDSLGGYPVVAIASNAYENFQMESVVIPDGVRRIEGSAFLNCFNLSEITIPQSVSIIDPDAFRGCNNFTIISSSGSYAESYALSMGFSFADCNSAEVRIKDFVESYGVPLYNKLNSFNGTVTAENIDDIIFLSFYFSELNKESYTKAEIEEIVQKHFVVNSFDLSLSSFYDAENDSYTPAHEGRLGGAAVYEPSITQNGSIYDVTIPYILAGEDEITGNLYLALTEDLKIVRFCVEHTFDKETDSVCAKCGYNKEIAPSYDFYGTTGDCTWSLDGTTLTISGNGAMGDYTYSSPAPWGDWITKVVIEDGVTTIGDYVFYYCDKLISVTIPDSVTTIGNYAFAYCTSLTSITIPDSITTIRDYAFSGCHSLSNVTIPNSVTSIGEDAFSYCGNITSVTIGNGVTSIDESTFQGCKSLTSVTIPDGVITIGNYAFQGCGSLESITIPDSVTNIGTHSFQDCNSLTEIIIPSNVSSIGWKSFDGCRRLTTITIPNNITVIEEDTFRDCSNLTDVWYEGTSILNISIAKGSGNDDLISATWHYIDSDCDTVCNECGATRVASVAHVFDNEDDTECNVCGAPKYTPGDLDGKEGVTDADAIYLLYHTFLPDLYPVDQPVDYNGDTFVTDKDAVYLLYHTFLPDLYPIN